LFAWVQGARADNPQGLSPQTIKLPNGPASIKGLGESFAPNAFTGSGSFSVPLQLPPGALAPKLALVYAAGSGKGALGLSWDLPITRVYRTTAKGAPSFNENDRFAVSGAGLNDELVRLEPGSNKYRLKNEGSYALFERNPQNDSWIIRLPQGDTLFLGSAAASRERSARGSYAWFIDRHADPFGHETRYRYLEDSEKRLLQFVDYQVHAAAPYRNQVELVYEARPDPYTDYTYESPVRATKRLRRVIARHGTSAIYTYELRYTQDELHSLLSAVDMKGADGTPIPTLRFDYVRLGDSGARYGKMSGAVPYEGLATGSTVLEDVNGDGLPDLLVGEAGNYRYFENYDGASFLQSPTLLRGGSPDCALGSPGTLLADMNGDGFRDVLCTTGGRLAYFAGGDIFQGTFRGYRAVTFVSGLEAVPDLTAPTVKALDANKDGRTDFLLENDGSPVLYLNRGSGSFSPGPPPVLPTDAPFALPQVSLMDWNGDGELDVVRDEVGRDLGTVRVWYGAGNARFLAGSELRGPDGLAEWFHWVDVNRDGQTDLVRYTGSYVGYYLNTGNGQLKQARAILENAPPSYDVIKTLFADLNGNGTTDIVWLTNGLELRYADLVSDASAGLLSRVDNGMGAVTDIAYGTSTDYLVAAKRRNERWKTTLPSPVPVISEIRTTDSLDLVGMEASESIVRFQYDHGYYDGFEREFRGFARVISTDVGDEFSATRVTEIWHHVGRNLATLADEESLKGRAYLTFVRDGGGALLKSTQTRWERRWLCQERVPSGLPRILPDCGSSADRDQRKDSLVALSVATDSLSAAWDKLPGAGGATTPDLSGGHVEYDDIWGRPTLEANYGEVQIPSGYTLGSEWSWSAAKLDIANDESGTFTHYVDTIREGNDPRWLIGLAACKANVQLSDGALPSVATLEANCRGTAAPSASVLALTRSFYDQSNTYGDADRGLATRKEAWLAPLGPNAGRWVSTAKVTYTAHGLPRVVEDALGDQKIITYDDAATALLPIEERFNIRDDGASGVSSVVYTASYNTAFGAVERASEPNGHASIYRYDGLGRIKSVLDEGDSEQDPEISYSYEFGTRDRPVSTVTTREKDPVSGRVSWSYSYVDGFGRPRMTKMPAEEPYGFVTSNFVRFGPRGQKTHVYSAFASSALFVEAPPAGSPVTVTKYDALDRVIETQSPPTAGAKSTTQIMHFSGFQQEAFDERDTLENAFLRPVITRVDGQGRIRSVTKQNDFDGTFKPLTWRVDYDALGRIVHFKDAQENPRSFQYDTLGRLVKVVDPSLGIVSYEFDDLGNRIKRRDAVGEESVIYGSFNRVVAKSFHALDGTTPDRAYFYHYDKADPAGPLAGAQRLIGRLAWVEHPVGRRDLSYDDEGNVTTVLETLWDGVSPRNAQVRTSHRKDVEYDAFGNKIKIKLPGGFETRFTYNRRGSVDGIYARFGTQDEQAVWSDIRYDTRGHAQEALNGNGIRSCWRWDAEGRLESTLVGRSADTQCKVLDDPNLDGQSVRNVGITQLRYFRAYDDLITEVVDLGQTIPDVPNRSATYKYDRLHELIEARTSLATYSFSYDAIQNLTQQTVRALGKPAATTRYHHGEGDAPPNAVTSVCTEAQCSAQEKISLFYDAAGRLRSYRGYDLTFDVEGRLVQALRPGGDSVEFFYDDAGELKLTVRTAGGERQVHRQIFQGYEERDGEQIWYLEGPAGRAEATRMPGLKIDTNVLDALNQFVALGGPRPVPVEYADLDGDGNLTFDKGDVAFAAQNKGKRVGGTKTVWRYYVKDAIDSTTHFLDSTGELTGVVHYAPYGSTEANWGLDPNWGFAGARWPDSSELGLIPMGARAYAPELGRWVSPDRFIGEKPAKVASQHLDNNLYGYSRNNPATYHDPGGREPITLTVAAIAALVWIGKAATEGAVDTLLDLSMAYLAGEEFGWKDASFSFASSMGMALVGAGIAAHGKKLYKLAQFIRKNGDKAKDLMGPLRKLLDVAGDKLGPAARELRNSLDELAAKLKSKVGCGKGVCGDGCFVAGTLVLTTLGAVPIEQLALGDHVLTSAMALAQAPADEPYVRIAARFEHDGDVWDVELLRTQSWFEREVLLDHTFVLEISDTLTAQARVLDVQPAFLDADAPGSLVTGRFDHTSHNVYELVFEGADAVVRTTGDHPFYSADRAAFVPASELAIGEAVETANGTLRVSSARALEGTYRVYNLEVAGAHEYLVTTEGFRVHNYPDADGAKGLIGGDFERWLHHKLGATRPNFSVGGREFDGAIGSRWFEAKSGNYWENIVSSEEGLRKFKSDMGDRLRIALDNNASYELHSNTPIPDHVKSWLTKKGIKFFEH
jgi:RHS repeat-associated protein